MLPMRTNNRMERKVVVMINEQLKKYCAKTQQYVINECCFTFDYKHIMEKLILKLIYYKIEIFRYFVIHSNIHTFLI